ncbi:transposase, partial [Shigella dysenteriae]
STLKSPSYTKSVSWQHYQVLLITRIKLKARLISFKVINIDHDVNV